MAIINCSAKKCVYNRTGSCKKRQINIIGVRARRSDDTECINYIEGDNKSYSFEFAEMESSISNNTLNCTASNCLHNKKYVCKKDKVSISGYTLDSMNETCCDSFIE